MEVEASTETIYIPFLIESQTMSKTKKKKNNTIFVLWGRQQWLGWDHRLSRLTNRRVWAPLTGCPEVVTLGLFPTISPAVPNTRDWNSLPWHYDGGVNAVALRLFKLKIGPERILPSKTSIFACGHWPNFSSRAAESPYNTKWSLEVYSQITLCILYFFLDGLPEPLKYSAFLNNNRI